MGVVGFYFVKKNQLINDISFALDFFFFLQFFFLNCKIISMCQIFIG